MCAFQRGNVNSNQQSVQVYTLSEGASCMHFALTVGEKKICRKYPERLGSFILIRKLKHTKNEIKTHSKTWCNLCNIWRRISKPLALTRRINCKSSLQASDFEQVTNHQQINWVGIHKNLFFFKVFQSQNGKQNQPFWVLIPDQLFTFIG